jgi:AcrR family transcriptional regulator
MGLEAKRRPGRPRSEEARQAILEAALALAAERGPGAITMEAIAQRAQVSKDTLYRWWRSRTEVVLEALGGYGDEVIPVPDTGSLAGDLRAFLRATAKALDPATRQLLRALAAGAASDPAFAETVRRQFLARRRTALAAILERAAARGELAEDRVTTVVDLVFGSLWYRLIFDVGSLDRPWADGITDAIARPTP